MAIQLPISTEVPTRTEELLVEQDSVPRTSASLAQQRGKGTFYESKVKRTPMGLAILDQYS